MENLKPITVQVHVVNGLTRVFHQDNPELIATIFNDFDGRLFTQSTLIIESTDGATAFSGHALVGVSILTEEIPTSIISREGMSTTVVTQITQEDFLRLRQENTPKVEGSRSSIFCEIVFIGGEHLYLEFSEVAIGGMGERAKMHHLFTNPSLLCRRLGGGFSLWNTAQFASWSHSPKLEAPSEAWKAVEALETQHTHVKTF